MIKTKCVSSGCNNDLPGTQEYYEIHGNYCFKCIYEINKKLGNHNMSKSLRNRLIMAGILKDE